MKQVTKEEYMDYFKTHKMRPVSSFTDMDGVIPFGYGCPAADTDWAEDGSDKVTARVEMRKESRDDNFWQFTYYLEERRQRC